MRARVALVALVVVALSITQPAVASAASSAAGAANTRDVRAALEAFRAVAPARYATTAASTPSTTARPFPKVSVRDRAGDAGSSHGDITGAGFAQDASGFTFGMTVASPTDPGHDANWANGAVAAWLLDTDEDAVPDDIVGLLSDGNGGLLALLVPASSFSSISTLKVCAGTGSYVAGSGYEATFPTHCLRPGLWFRFQAAMVYPRGSADPIPSLDVAPDAGWSAANVTTQVAGRSGYWLLDAGGRVGAFGGADGFAGSVSGAVALAPRRDGTGYWVAGRAGDVYAYGTARYLGGSPPMTAGEFVSAIAATATGRGYWLFTDRGRVFAFGDAKWYGDMSGTRLAGAIVAAAATSTGRGYYLVGSDGGVFTFGDARFRGSTGALRLAAPIVGIAAAGRGGYWLVASDGGVFAFGARFRGSMGAVHLAQPVTAIARYGNGYLLAAVDGGVFAFADRPFHGGLANRVRLAPVVGIAAFTT
jgi:hypothetical protein